MLSLPQFLLFSLLLWITPLTATLKMALAYGVFKLITLGLSPRSIGSNHQQGRLFGGWGVGWAIAIQNLDELRQGDYLAFLTHAGFNIFLTGITAYLCGRVWFQYKNRQQAAKPLDEPENSQALNPVLRLKPLTLVFYATLLMVLLLFKTGTAQFQLAQLYESGYLLKQNHDKALFWYQKSADKGNSAAAEQIK